MNFAYKQQYTIEGSYTVCNVSGTHLQKYKLEDWYNSKIDAEKCASNMTSKTNNSSYVYSLLYRTKEINDYIVHTRLVNFTTPDGDKTKIAVLSD